MFNNKDKLSASDLNYVDDIKEAILTQSPRYTKYTLYLLLGLVISALTWAKYAIIPIHTTADGKVVTSSSVQVIQNLEGGIIKSIEVKEGQQVKKGQILARFDDTRFAATYKRELTKKAVLEIEIIRLKTEAAGGESLDIPEDFAKKHPDLVQHALEVFDKDKRSLQEQIKILNDSKNLVAKELAIIKPLSERGAVSELERIRLERQLNTIRSQIKEKEERARNEARDELNRVKNEYTVLVEQIATSEDRAKRTVIKSPVDGIVNKVYISTIGQVINPGIKIMDIVPMDDKMTVVLKVPPSEIGFLKSGLKATVKVSAYDYALYGSLDATIINIGSDAITDKQGNSFYEVKLQTAKNHLGSDEKPLRIMPGMNVTANILTGERSVLSYLVKPFIDLGGTAFQAR